MTLSNFHQALHKKDKKKTGVLDDGQKWCVSVLIGFLFIILSSRGSYKITNRLFGSRNCESSKNITYYGYGGATTGGLVIHGILFILFVRAIFEINL